MVCAQHTVSVEWPMVCAQHTVSVEQLMVCAQQTESVEWPTMYAQHTLGSHRGGTENQLLVSVGSVPGGSTWEGAPFTN